MRPTLERVAAVTCSSHGRKIGGNMTRCTSIAPLGSQFDSFLFAPIGEERNGTLLSVVSALARLDVDPWEEATELSRLPGDTATQRLASLIAALPEGTSAHLDSQSIAARLIALLPCRVASNSSTREASLGARAATNPEASKHRVLYMIVMAVVLGVQMMVASHRLPAPIDNTASTSRTDISEAPPR